MKIGWIGAGKVGVSLGKYLAEQGVSVVGYYSKNPESAKEAAEFTGTSCYERIEDLVRDSEVIFLTVPDDAIEEVWGQLKQLQIKDKCFCHCSGALSSEVFSDRTGHFAYGYSIHPLLAVNDKFHSYSELSNALFTIEGDGAYKEHLQKLFEKAGNTVLPIRAKDKIRYHAAAVMASNLVLGLAEAATEELEGCGFTREMAQNALVPFLQANVAHLGDRKIEDCLTGPVERGDTSTVAKHLAHLSGEHRVIYHTLSKKVLSIAKRKNSGRNYQGLEELLEGENE